MKNWPPILWVVFVALIIFIISICTIMYVHYKAAHILSLYGIWGILLSLWFYYMSRGCVEIHIHHYALMMILLSFICWQDVFTTLLCGIFNGIMIEGVSMYGFGPIFINSLNNEQLSTIKKE